MQTPTGLEIWPTSGSYLTPKGRHSFKQIWLIWQQSYLITTLRRNRLVRGRNEFGIFNSACRMWRVTPGKPARAHIKRSEEKRLSGKRKSRKSENMLFWTAHTHTHTRTLAWPIKEEAMELRR